MSLRAVRAVRGLCVSLKPEGRLTTGVFMQRVLEKIAKKLNEYDEASLMLLWQHYAERVHDFEPTKRWEEATIALCLIQAVHWKNQLFNHHLALSAGPVDKDALPTLPDFFRGPKEEKPQEAAKPRKRATVLPFRPCFEQDGKDGGTNAGDKDPGGPKAGSADTAGTDTSSTGVTGKDAGSREADKGDTADAGSASPAGGGKNRPGNSSGRRPGPADDLER